MSDNQSIADFEGFFLPSEFFSAAVYFEISKVSLKNSIIEASCHF